MMATRARAVHHRQRLLPAKSTIAATISNVIFIGDLASHKSIAIGCIVL